MYNELIIFVVSLVSDNSFEAVLAILLSRFKKKKKQPLLFAILFQWE